MDFLKYPGGSTLAQKGYPVHSTRHLRPRWSARWIAALASAVTGASCLPDSPLTAGVVGGGGNSPTGETPANGPAHPGGEAAAAVEHARADAASADCSVDTDFDMVGDCLDECPDDFIKVSPGMCGCGEPDVDIDQDGTLDCLESCPVDIGKTAPGVCGCGAPDADADADGTLDCNDGCPFDATRTTPGACGCGAPDDLPLCLRHRYSFDGGGAMALDTAGTAHATIFNTTLSGQGTLVLAGVATDQYVELPAGTISTLGRNATFEIWLTWTGAGAPWQRIFDFGSNGPTPGLQGVGLTYLFLTPSNTINTHLRAAYTVAGPAAEHAANAPTALPFLTRVYLAVVIDGDAQILSLYQNGVLVASAPTLGTRLEDLKDVNNWLGRSQFVLDEEFQGTLDEFRIYGTARSAAQIDAAFADGPDVLPEE